MELSAVKELSVLSPNFNKTKKAKTYGFANLRALSCVSKQNMVKMVADPEPYHTFYTTLHDVQYQTVSAAIPATRDKPSPIVTYLHLKT